MIFLMINGFLILMLLICFGLVLFYRNKSIKASATDILKCGNCGSVLEKDSAFCGECGTQIKIKTGVNVDSSSMMDVNNKQQSSIYIKRRKRAKCFLLIFFLLFILFNVIVLGMAKYYETNVESTDYTIKSNIQFKDDEGNVVLDKDDILSADSMFGKINEDEKAQYYIQLMLTPGGQKKFEEATRIISQKTDGTNFISIMIDDEILTSPKVSAVIDSDSVIITGDFTAETVEEMVEYIRTGAKKNVENMTDEM